MLVLVRVVVALFILLLPLQGAARQHPLQQVVIGQTEEQTWASHKQPLTRDIIYHYNIDWRHNSGRLVITETIDSSKFSNVTGDIDFVAGDSQQGHDVIVLVRMVSDSVDTLDQLFTRTEGQELIVGSEVESPSANSAVALNVVVFIKPHCLQMGVEGTTVDTMNLDITIWPGLDFETYHMSLTTDRGIITGSEINTFTAHQIVVRAKHGHIFGNWSLPSSIRLITWVGNIDVDLIPKRWSSGSSTPGDIHAEANKGDVTIRMPFDRDKLSLRNGSTTIQSVGGVISGTLVHSAYTNILSQWYGSINLTLLPYWTFSEWRGIQYNYLRTDQFHRNTFLRILPPVIDSYFPINPLCLMKSYHKTIMGQMYISYPREWCGTMTGNATNIPRGPDEARVYVSGEDFELLVEEPHHIVAQRRPLGSHIDLDVVSGQGYLQLR